MDHFIKELKKFKRTRQRWLLYCLFVQSLGLLAIATALLCWLDLLFAGSSTLRMILNAAALSGLAIWLIWGVWGIFRISDKEAAMHADSLLKSRRREILSALEVGQSVANESAVAEYLAISGIESARERLKSLTDVRPTAKMTRAHRRFAACLILALVPVLLNLAAARVLIGRVFLPHTDIPPYSAYTFDVSPQAPSVIYGNDLVIKVSIGGKTVGQPVRFVTRQAGHILTSSCFQSTPSEYLQKLERVMQPMDYCFRTGKARSKWHRLTVLYQPRIQSAQIRILPPDYAKQPEKNFALGSEPLKGLKGARVEMRVQSNRPLKAGELTIAATERQAEARTITGKVTDKHEIVYAWTIESSAQLSIVIYDTLGTAVRRPLRVMQEVVPDMAPVVSLSEPTRFALATPSTTVPVYGTVEDDLGIQRCDLYRALKGYRSRPARIERDPGTSDLEVKRELNLAALGVVPGQVIELFLEASDTNPALTGIGTSDIVRVKIIAEDEYAKMVRAKTTLASFERRFLILAKEYHQLMQMLSQAQAEFRNGEPGTITPEKIAGLHAKMKAAADAFQALADDFAAFDLEKRLSQTAQEVVDKLHYAMGYEGWQSEDPQRVAEALSKSITLLKKQARAVENIRTDARETAAVGRVMEMAVQYRALLDRQAILVQKFKRYAAGERKLSKPQVLAQQEDRVREDLEAFIATLAQRAEQLPEAYQGLLMSTYQFVETLRDLEIPVPMQACSRASRDEQPRKALQHAAVALEKMQLALERCKNSPFEQACSGGMGFPVPDHLSQTMAEMLRSLQQRYGSGFGQGGTGTGGLGGDWMGSYMNGYSAFDAPIYGPKRNDYQASGLAAKGDAKGQSGAKGASRESAQYHEVMAATATPQTHGDGFIMQNVPPRYRDAVRAFYDQEVPP